MKKNQEQQIKNIMETLEVSREEALEIIAFDNEEFELDEVKEMEAKAKDLQKTEIKKGRKPRAKGEGVAGVTQQKRAKKENPVKQSIIKALEKAVLEELGIPRELVEVTNKEKTIIVKAFGETYEIDLKQKRKPKES